MPLASIVIPCFNREDLVTETLESCVKQTVKDIEIIAVDDGSQDRTVKVIRKFAELDSRVRVVCSVNQGLSGARNVGFTYASAPWLMFLDSDDLLHPKALEYLLKAAHEHQVKLVVGGEAGFATEELESIWELVLREDKQLFTEKVCYGCIKNFLDNSASSFNNVLIHRQLFIDAGGFNSQLRGCEDSEMFYRLAVKLPEEPVLKFVTPLVTLKRIADNTLARQVGRKDSPWIPRSSRFIAKNILDYVPYKKLSDYQREFDDLYRVACYAFRNSLYDEAIGCWLIWRKAGLDHPKITPNYHGILHQIFGWLGAELLLSLARYLKSDEAVINNK